MVKNLFRSKYLAIITFLALAFWGLLIANDFTPSTTVYAVDPTPVPTPVVWSVPWITTYIQTGGGYDSADTSYYSIPTNATNARIDFDWTSYGKGPDEIGVYTDRLIYYTHNWDLGPDDSYYYSQHAGHLLAPGQSIRVHLFHNNYLEYTGLNNTVWANNITIRFSYNMLPNPGLDSSLDGWYCVTDTSADADISRDTSDYDSSPASLEVDCTSNGNSNSSIELYTGPFCIQQNKTYLLTFKAKASAMFTIPSIKLKQNGSPYDDYSNIYANLTVGTSWKDYAVILTADTTAADARLSFLLGDALPDGATFNIDTLRLGEFTAESPVTGELLPNPNFDIGTENWSLSNDTSAEAYGSLDALDFCGFPVSYQIQCVNNGDTSNSIQFFTAPASITQNKVYQFTFKAKCSTAFTIPYIRMVSNTDPSTKYANQIFNVAISTDWETYTVEFTTNTTADDARITLYLGTAIPEGATFKIDSTSLIEIQ